MTVSGQRQRCEGVGRVQFRVCDSDSVVVDVNIVDFKPLGAEFILGINGISAIWRDDLPFTCDAFWLS